MSTKSAIAYDLFFNKNWRIVRRVDDHTFVISHAVTQKVIAVYWTQDPLKVKGVFTTNHFNDNFTVDFRRFAVENWAFGVAKLMVAKFEAIERWSVDAPETRQALLASMTLMESEVVKIAGGHDDALVSYCRAVLEERHDFGGMTTLQLYHFWQSKAENLLRLIPLTTQKIAKEGIGRKVPGELLEPFFRHSQTIVAYLHAYKHSYEFCETAMFLGESMAEEISRKDDLWALALGEDFRGAMDEAHLRRVLDHLREYDVPQRKLGVALNMARDYVRETLTSEASIGSEEANLYLTKCGFFDLFEKVQRVSLCNLKMQHSNREKEMLLEVASGKVTIRDVLEEMQKYH